MSTLVVVLEKRGSLFSIDFVFMTGGWVGISEIKFDFCYVPMPGILPVSESG